MTRLGWFVCCAVCAVALAPPAFAQKDACGLVTQQQVASIVGAAVNAAKLRDGAIQQACSYLTAASGDSSAGMVSLSVFKVPLATADAGLMIQPGDKLIPVSGVGDEATMDADTHELKFRVGTTWIAVVTRGAPCPGDVIGASQDVKDACKVKRNTMLTTLARVAAAAAK